jgi:hypothetical protein
MDPEFKTAWKELSVDWLSWLGQPMLYDGGLCVNRTAEEHKERNKHPESKLII